MTLRAGARHRRRTRREIPVSAELTRLLELFSAGDSMPVGERPSSAAAVVLIRDAARDSARGDGSGGVEVFVTRRSAGREVEERSRWAFPSSAVRASDVRRLPQSGWTPKRLAAALRIDDRTRALGWTAAAARACLQSTGVVLAESSDGRVVGENRSDDWDADRRELSERRLSLGQALDDHGLRLRTDLLKPWLRWINPAVQLRRHDTVFFLVAAPQGQSVRFAGLEEVWSGWRTPAEVLELSDPTESSADLIAASTRLVCESLLDTPSVGAAMLAVRDLAPIRPEIVRHDEAWWLSVDVPADLTARGAERGLGEWDGDEPDEEPGATVGGLAEGEDDEDDDIDDDV